MPKLRVHSFAASVDGYGAGPNQNLDRELLIDERVKRTMNARRVDSEVHREGAGHGLFERLRRWWHLPDREGQFLAAATDLADLERRMRILDRLGGGPVFETRNPVELVTPTVRSPVPRLSRDADDER